MAAKKWNILDMTLIAMFTGVMTICAWISIPFTVPFTLQTFGVFLTVSVLGGKRGSLAVLTYLLLGAVGVPVFAGFTGGVGHFLGSTGGYAIGLLFIALIMWWMEKVPGKRRQILICSMVAGLLVCYAFGTAWFCLVYSVNHGRVGLGTALMWCVVPYMIPDGIKIALAISLGEKLSARL